MDKLPIVVRNAIRTHLELHVKRLVERGAKPAIQAGKKWKYKNASDWHHGHFVGMMESSAVSLYHQLYSGELTIEQMMEIEEIIEEYGNKLRDYFQSLDSDKC